MNIRYIAFLSLALPFFFVTQAYASGTDCTTMYGGGYTSTQSCAKIIIDKKVLKPGTSDFVDGLSAIDPKYEIGQNISFQIVVQNAGDENLSNITVVDSFPQNVVYVSGAGNYDSKSNKLTFTIDHLASGESQTFYIVAKVTDTMAFGDNGYVCVSNVVDATENDLTAEDAAQFCVERPLQVAPPVLGMKKTPSTGPVDAALPMLFGMAGAGAFLRKKVK